VWLAANVALALGCGSNLDVHRTQGTTSTGESSATLPDCSKMEPPATRADAGAMVRAGRLDGTCFWIDQHEVTVGEYAAFSKNPTGFAMPADCAGHAGFAPRGCTPGADAGLPITCVDWCDAAAYCLWAGKKLCGGSSPESDVGDAHQSNWFSACSNGGVAEYPYGTKFDPKACNLPAADTNCGAASASCAPWPETSAHATCMAPSGALDLLGNVAEWVDEGCEPGKSGACLARGGDYFTGGGADVTCGPSNGVASLPRDHTFPYVGFRCCAP
jgi:formylglycine-generating enzyme required for sulfatase activity